MTAPCCVCDKPASALLRIVPRRDCDPLNDAMRRAVAWPGAADPVSVPYCGAPACKDRVRAASTVVLGEAPITEPTETTA